MSRMGGENNVSLHLSARVAAASLLRVFRSSKNVETSPKIAKSESRSRANFATCADERQPRQSGILDLHGDEQSVCRIEGVDGQKPERRWAINLHVMRGESFL